MKILVLADIHGNATATEAVLKQERDFDSVIFLGDSVSPGPQPNETLALLSELKGIFIEGNHERSMLDPQSTAQWPSGFKAFMDWIREEFDPQGFSFLRSFQKSAELEVDGKLFRCVHGDENREARHLLPDSPATSFEPLVESDAEATVLFGHSHIQFTRTIGEQTFINVGSVGQNRCGHVVACYGLITDGEFTHQHVRYDPQPWLDAVDRVKPLNNHSEFKDWFKQQCVTGFANGAVDPWLRFANEGYR